MHTVMYYHIHTCIYTHIQTFNFIRKLDIMLMNAKWYSVPNTLSPRLPRSYKIYIHTYILVHTNILFHTNKHKIVCRSQYALPVSTTLLRRWYYVNAVPTTLVLHQSSS